MLSVSDMSSFPRFLDLPNEPQRQVWEQAVLLTTDFNRCPLTTQLFTEIRKLRFRMTGSTRLYTRFTNVIINHCPDFASLMRSRWYPHKLGLEVLRKALEEIKVSPGYARIMKRDVLRVLDERIGNLRA